MTMELLEPLTSAAVVFRDAPSAQHTDLVALRHVVQTVSAFLDGAEPSRWSVDQAYESGFGIRMLARLSVYEAPTDVFFRAFVAGKALLAAVRNDDLDVVRGICSVVCPTVVPVKAMVEAAAGGRRRVLEWLLGAYPSVPVNAYLAEKATERGHLDVLQWILAQLVPPVDELKRLLAIAARHGRFDLVQWLDLELWRLGAPALVTDVTSPQTALSQAIAEGHFAVAKYLADHGYPLGRLARSHTPPACVKTGDLAMIKWLHTRQFVTDAAGWIDAAAAGGHVHVAQWVHDTFPTDAATSLAMDVAAQNGQLGYVQWLHTHRTEGCTVRAMDGAAENGHLKTVQWLHAHRTEGCTTKAMDSAARNGHVEVLEWLHTHCSEGCTTDAMDAAAGAGRLRIVQWLHEHRTEGCTVSAMDGAASNGHLDVVQWLHSHRPEGCSTAAMDGAAAEGELATLEWLHEHRTEGCTTWAMDLAAECDIDTVKWLHEHRTEGCTTAAMDNAASVRMLQWLHSQRVEGCSELATTDAVRSENLEKLVFLKANRLLRLEAVDSVADLVRRGCFEVFQWVRVNALELVGAEAIERDAMASMKEPAMFFQFEAGHRRHVSQ